MDVDELEAVVDEMSEECGDQIDALYDTVTLNKDTYNGFICRLREVVRLAKNEQEKSAPVGNAAKLREVMKVIHRIAYDAKSDFDVFAGIEKINRISADALASPPRNCDRFATVKDAAIAFARERQDAPHPCPDFIFSTWLYAPATEQEKENNGRK